jgi:hypothetical protein
MEEASRMSRSSPVPLGEASLFTLEISNTIQSNPKAYQAFLITTPLLFPHQYITNGTGMGTSLSTGDGELAAGAGPGESFQRGRIQKSSKVMDMKSFEKIIHIKLLNT